MKVCMVVPYDLAEEGGVKRHATQLAASLRKLGDHVDVIGPCSNKDKIAGAEGVHGFRGVANVSANSSDNRLGLFVCPHLVHRFVADGEYDVIHVHEPLQPSLNYYAVWSVSSRAARVATFHAYSENESARLRRARRFWAHIAFPAYDRGIAVSPAAVEYARVSFKKPLAIIPNGIRTELYRPGAPAVAGAPLKILFVGHWRDSRKGLPVLLDAVGKLAARGVAYTLDIVGDGGQVPRSELPGVTYHGPISGESRIAEIYAGCDVFVSPATGGESFGIVLLEAMASARAIVCSDIAGYRYAVGSGPDCGALLTTPGNSDELAGALEKLAGDPAARDRMGAVNRARVPLFDWEQLVERVRDEYCAALEGRGRVLEAQPRPVASSTNAAV